MSELLVRLAGITNVAELLGQASGLVVYPRSIVLNGGTLFFLGREGTSKRLGILATVRAESGFVLQVRPVSMQGESLFLGLGELSHANAAALRTRLPFTAPTRIGVLKSAGLGDRLGIATPGHIRALRHVKGIMPVFAQQSIREMERTQRTPDQVMDAATWGVFQEGWTTGFGADADHLKTPADIDLCVAAGFVLYTLDPREHVDNQAESDPLARLQTKFAGLPWDRLKTTPAATRSAYAGRTWTLAPDYTLAMNESQLLRAACKYGRALAHLAEMYQYLQRVMDGRDYELEVSVDETEVPTTPEEHWYIASELRRLGVQWVSLAPRYVGRFEKGVDYIGDLALFEADFRRHVAIARALGPYKLSLHSGSDKFSIYPIAARVAGDLVHLKTAGTSYLEALRAIARIDPALFREILGFAIANYEHDKASYHVSAELSKVPAPEALADADLGAVLDQFDAREALHVTFGTVLTAVDGQGSHIFRKRIFARLEADEEAHYAALEAHLTRHLLPFTD